MKNKKKAFFIYFKTKLFMKLALITIFSFIYIIEKIWFYYFKFVLEKIREKAIKTVFYQLNRTALTSKIKNFSDNLKYK